MRTVSFPVLFPVFASALALGLLTVSGCGAHAPSSPALHVYAGLDASGSARSHLGGYTLLCGQAAARLHAGQDRITLFRVDSQTDEFSDRLASGSMDDTLVSIAANVRQAAPRPRTLPARFWKTIAQRAGQSQERVAVIFYTDGDNDDMTAASDADIRATAQVLARNAQVRAVIVCGAESRNWNRLRACFAPLGEGRFTLLNPAEMDINTLAARLEQARQ